MFKRKIYRKLLEWKRDSDGHTAILVEGARRIGKSTTYRLIQDFYVSGRPLGQDANRRHLRAFRLYMLVGGMPQAIKEYLESNSFRKVDAIKRDIIKLYLDAFSKKFSSQILRKYLLYTRDIQKDEDVFCLPVYMMPFL